MKGTIESDVKTLSELILELIEMKIENKNAI